LGVSPAAGAIALARRSPFISGVANIDFAQDLSRLDEYQTDLSGGTTGCVDCHGLSGLNKPRLTHLGVPADVWPRGITADDMFSNRPIASGWRYSLGGQATVSTACTFLGVT